MTDARAAIVRIWSGKHPRKFLGSGFLISPNCVVTCHHVIRDRKDEDIFVNGPAFLGGWRRVAGINSHPTLDVSALEIDQPTKDTPAALSISHLGSKPTKQAEILVLGYADAEGDLVETNVKV